MLNEAQATETEVSPGTEEDLNNEVDAVEASTTEAAEEDNPDTEAEPEVKEPEKKPTGIQRRFHKYDEQLKAQAAELEYWKKAALEQGKAPVAQTTTAKLKLADFDSVEDFIEARETQLRAQLLQEVTTAAEAKTKATTVEQQYSQKVQSVKKELEDWDDVMELAADEPTAPETVQFCMDSDIGPRIAYHLAKNPEFHDSLNAMSPVRRIAELGKLEERLTTKKTEPKPVTKAPAKLSNVSGGGSPVRLDPGAATSYAEWKKADDARKAAAKKR